MSIQTFVSTTNIVPIANQTALVATTEEVCVPTQYTGIAANEAYPGKAWRFRCGGIVTLAGTTTLTLTPRVGLVIGGITLGVSVVTLTAPGVVTNVPFVIDFTLVCRTIGAPGANSTFIGTGTFVTCGTGTAGTSCIQVMGGTSATADASIATGLWMGKTFAVGASSMTTQWSTFESLN